MFRFCHFKAHHFISERAHGNFFSIFLKTCKLLAIVTILLNRVFVYDRWMNGFMVHHYKCYQFTICCLQRKGCWTHYIPSVVLLNSQRTEDWLKGAVKMQRRLSFKLKKALARFFQGRVLQSEWRPRRKGSLGRGFQTRVITFFNFFSIR